MHLKCKEGPVTPRVGIDSYLTALWMDTGPMILRCTSVVRAHPMAALRSPPKELG